MSELRTPDAMSRPILFSAPMVRAILEGRKTQTRRVIKHGFEYDYDDGWPMAEDEDGIWQRVPCPYGKPGDALWVRETCRAHEITDEEALADKYGVMARLGLEMPPYGLDGVIYAADGTFREIENTIAASIAWGELHAYRGKAGATVPPIHMPRWASRITLGVMSVRVQRLQDISERDCCAEGCGSPITRDWKKPKFRELWESINGAGSWDVNPWIWAVEFERIGVRAAA
jgi:hypothetical protein